MRFPDCGRALFWNTEMLNRQFAFFTLRCPRRAFTCVSLRRGWLREWNNRRFNVSMKERGILKSPTCAHSSKQIWLTLIKETKRKERVQSLSVEENRFHAEDPPPWLAAWEQSATLLRQPIKGVKLERKAFERRRQTAGLWESFNFCRVFFPFDTFTGNPPSSSSNSQQGGNFKAAPPESTGKLSPLHQGETGAEKGREFTRKRSTPILRQWRVCSPTAKEGRE